MKKIDSGLQVRIQKFLKIGFARGLGLNALSLVFFHYFLFSDDVDILILNCFDMHFFRNA